MSFGRDFPSHYIEQNQYPLRILKAHEFADQSLERAAIDHDFVSRLKNGMWQFNTTISCLSGCDGLNQPFWYR